MHSGPYPDGDGHKIWRDSGENLCTLPDISYNGRMAAENGCGSRNAAIKVVVIAASLGGVEAISRLLRELPKDLSVPVLVVQHLSPDCPSVLDKIVQGRSILNVKWATEGETLNPGTVYLAIPNRHLIVTPDGKLSLQASDRVDWVRPAADVLLESVAQRFGQSALAVILTGSLNDGMQGAMHIKRCGGWVLAQDESSSRCFEMPRAAIRAGAVDFVLPLDSLPFAISCLTMTVGATDLFRVPCKLAEAGGECLHSAFS